MIEDLRPPTWVIAVLALVGFCVFGVEAFEHVYSCRQAIRIHYDAEEFFNRHPRPGAFIIDDMYQPLLELAESRFPRYEAGQLSRAVAKIEASTHPTTDEITSEPVLSYPLIVFDNEPLADALENVCLMPVAATLRRGDVLIPSGW